MSRIFGIVNLTEDSFSDGGRFLSEERISDLIAKHRDDGCWGVDLGPESSNAAGKPVPRDIQKDRIRLAAGLAREMRMPIAIDSPYPEIVEYALECGAVFVNDISGLDDSRLRAIVRSAGVPAAMMCNLRPLKFRAGPYNAPSLDRLLPEIQNWIDNKTEQLLAEGMDTRKIWLDPGMGLFLGNNPDLSFKMLANYSQLKQDYAGWYFGVSRKGFLAMNGQDPAAREYATLAAEWFLWQNGVDYIRTHDAGKIRDFVEIMRKISEFRAS